MLVQKVDDDGTWWWPSSDERCWDGLHRWGDVPDIIMSHVPVKDVIVQAGGNCGLYVKKYAQQFKTVYTFEPFPELFKCLVLNVPDENVIKIQGCVGNRHELVAMKEHEFNDIGGGHVSGQGAVPTFLIDDLALTECNLIHLDIEGYEPFALEGAKETIRRCSPVICVENCEKWLKRYGKATSDIDSFLAALGYSHTDDARGDRIYRHSG